MAQALFSSPPVFDLPFTKGDDLSVRFVYKEPVLDDQGQPVVVGGKTQYQVADYPAGTTVQMEIDTRPTPRVYIAEIAGHDAKVHEPFADVDVIPQGVSWRTKIIYEDGLTKVAAHGKTVRHD